MVQDEAPPPNINGAPASDTLGTTVNHSVIREGHAVSIHDNSAGVTPRTFSFCLYKASLHDQVRCCDAHAASIATIKGTNRKPPPILEGEGFSRSDGDRPTLS